MNPSTPDNAKVKVKVPFKRKVNQNVKCEICMETKDREQFVNNKRVYKRKICMKCYPEFAKTRLIKKPPTVNNKLKRIIGKYLKDKLKNKNVNVCEGTPRLNYLGCNIPYLREWFEYLFTPDLNWDNYGSKWVIDSIMPASEFDLTLDESRYRFCTWMNIIPISKDAYPIDKMYYIEKLNKFEEEGSTTKWFSGELLQGFENLKI